MFYINIWGEITQLQIRATPKEVNSDKGVKKGWDEVTFSLDRIYFLYICLLYFRYTN